jgi:PAS domain S-box-containing protein
MLQDVSPYLNPAVAVFTVMALGIYLFSLGGTHLIKTFFILMLVLLNVSWFLNGGSTGSIGYFYLSTVIIPIALFTHKTRAAMLLLIVFNYTALIFLEFRFPSLIVPFISSNDRYFDLLTGFVVSLLVTSIIFRMIVTNYDRKLIEHEKTEDELSRYRLNLEELVTVRTNELVKSETRFRSYVENANDIVFSLSAEGIFTYVSPNWKNAFGYEIDETVGKPFTTFVHPDDVSNCFAALQKVITTGEKQADIEYRVLCKVDNYIWYSANGSRLVDSENNEATFLGVGRDISEHRRAEEERLTLEQQFQQSQKLESLGVMAGGIAHDFNNLLQSILGNMELAERVLAQNSKPQKLIANAIISGKQAALLTNLLLAYIGRGFIEKKKLSLNELIRENTEIMRSATTSLVSIEMTLSEELPAIIADEAQLQQLVMNLITNAAEAIDKQPGFVKISTGTQDCDRTCLAASLLDKKAEPGHYVFLEVKDSGCGMDEETLKRLFDPFFTTKFTGRGLGMSAVMGIVKTYSGALFVESKVGKGTTFRVLFPAQESVLQDTLQKPFASLPEKQAIPDNPLSGLALLVDDEKSVLKTCTKMLKLCGFTVITASDGMDAVTQFREHSDVIDVVVMDLTMPNMDGVTAMVEIREIRPDAKVILASGFNEEELSKRFIGFAAPSGFIRKPYSMNQLELELQRVMR